MKVVKLLDGERTKLAVLEGLVRASQQAFTDRQEFVNSLKKKYFPGEFTHFCNKFHIDESGQYLAVE